MAAQLPYHSPVVDKATGLLSQPYVYFLSQLANVIGIIVTPGGIAPSNGPFVVTAADPGLPDANVLTDTATIDFVTVGGATTAAVKDGSVTFAKMQAIATDKLLGRDSSGTGAPEEVAVSGGLEFTGGPGIQRAALTGDVTASAGSGATTIPAGTVTYAKMQDVGAADRLLGRGNGGGSGDVQELTLSARLGLTTTVLDTVGASGTFTTVDLKTVTVTNGIITSIV